MSNCVNIVNKRYEILLPKYKCKCCKQAFGKLTRQRYCQTAECKTMRRTAYQRNFRRKKAGIQELQK